MIVGSVFYFLWGTILNKGKIVLTGETPFEVNVYEAGEYTCEKSPCEIEQKIGVKNLIIQKEGREDLLIEVDVPFWGEAEHEIKFKFIPYLVKVDEIPALDSKKEFEITFDNKNKYYRLSEANSLVDEPIVFFQKEIKSPIIFGNDRSVLVIDGEDYEAYKVDRASNSRDKISGDFEGITKGSWSEDGSMFVFETKKTSNISVITKTNQIKALDIQREGTVYEWAYGSSIFFVTDQIFAPSTDTGKYSNYITVVDEITTDYSFGIYHSDEDTYSQIKNTSIVNSPTELIPASNGKIIYFEIGEEKFALHFE